MAQRIALVDDDQNILTSVSLMLEVKVLRWIPTVMVSRR